MSSSVYLLVTNTKELRGRRQRVEIDRLGAYMLGRRISDYRITMFNSENTNMKSIVLESSFCHEIDTQIKREYEAFITA